MLVRLEGAEPAGRKTAAALERAGLVVNKNTVPGETGTAVNPSGIRLGSPAATTFGFGPDEFREIGRLVAGVARNVEDDGPHRTHRGAGQGAVRRRRSPAGRARAAPASAPRVAAVP